jgi:hypothetical protein
MKYFYRTLISEDQAFFDPGVCRCRLVAHNGEPWKQGEGPFANIPLAGPIPEHSSVDLARESEIVKAIGEKADSPISVGMARSETSHESPQPGDFSGIYMFEFPRKSLCYHSTIIIQDDASALVIEKVLPCVFCDILHPVTPAEIYPVSMNSLSCPACKAKLQALRARMVDEGNSSSGVACDFCQCPIVPWAAFTLPVPKDLPVSPSDTFFLNPVVHLECAEAMGLDVQATTDEEVELRSVITNHNIMMTTQYLGPNAIDANENQWLLTLRRGDGRTWTTRFYGTTEDLRTSLRGAESTTLPACATILDLMCFETQFNWQDFDEFFAEYYFGPERLPTPWDRMFHKYVLAQSEGLYQFMEGIELPTA